MCLYLRMVWPGNPGIRQHGSVCPLPQLCSIGLPETFISTPFQTAVCGLHLAPDFLYLVHIILKTIIFISYHYFFFLYIRRLQIAFLDKSDLETWFAPCIGQLVLITLTSLHLLSGQWPSTVNFDKAQS